LVTAATWPAKLAVILSLIAPFFTSASHNLHLL
jgi:hypothetical protein